MSLPRAVAVTTALFAAVWITDPVRSSTLSVVGASTKVCQLTGQTDWLTGQATNTQTVSRYSLQGIDLGFPVENGKGILYFLFGDAVPAGHPPTDTVTPDDALGTTSRTVAPDSTTCLDMVFFSLGQGHTLAHPVVQPPIQQGTFNVPTGGVYVGGKFFAFFWSNHCVLPNAFGPNQTTPLALPAATTNCPETVTSNSIGRSVIAYATDSDPLTFSQIPLPSRWAANLKQQMPNGFVYVTAAKPRLRLWSLKRWHYRPPILVFGVARYRMSIPYLALAPQASFGTISTWSFYGGTGPNGPIWLTYDQWQGSRNGTQWGPPQGAELYANSPNNWSFSQDERCVGEHSVTWNAALQVWLMLYTCGGLQVEARTAPDPWGPWSSPTILLSAVENPGLFCTLFWSPPAPSPPAPPGTPTPCPGRTSSWPAPLTFGYFYAPFVMTRYTQDLTLPSPDQPKQATIYWLLSTWDPYQVMVMQSTLKLEP